MYLREIRRILDAKVLCGEENLDWEAHAACASDFMSDVLAYVKDQALLLTGMVNPQVVRTAEMMDMHCIVFVRGKEADPTVLHLADQRDMTILQTRYRMFAACGKLYEAGLRGGCEQE